MIDLQSSFSGAIGYVRRHRIKFALQAANIVFGVLALSLALSGVLPMSLVNFVFFSFLLLLVALYRPVWIFLLLVGMLPYEIVNLAPAEVGFMLRPYQWLMIILLGAVVIRWFVGRKAVPGLRFVWIDALPVVFSIGALIAAIGAHPSGPAFRLALILSSFVGLYFVVRLFIRSAKEAVHVVPFLLASFTIVALWSLMQNILFALGGAHFEVMAGRPNGSFSEPDWLGMYLLFFVALALAWLYRHLVLRQRLILSIAPSLLLFLASLVLFLSMTRSAWLGLAAMGAFFVLAVMTVSMKLGEPKRGVRLLGQSAGIIMVALLLIPLLHLSRFDIFDRAASTGGEQKITIACDQDSTLPVRLEKIESLDQLSAWHCRHIMLEDIGSEQAAGRFIATVYRNDPNVSIRKSIYERIFASGSERPVQGIGWGNIGTRLGSDERGAALNASNMFLEFWLGSGLIGLIAFSLLWFALGFQSGRLALSGGQEEVAFPLFLHLAWIGCTVFNLFNSGILLGFFFFLLGLGGLLFQRRS